MENVRMIKTVADLSYEITYTIHSIEHGGEETEHQSVMVSPVTAAIGLIYMIYDYAEKNKDGFACNKRFTHFIGYEGSPEDLKQILLRVGIVEEKDGLLFVCTESAQSER